MSHSGFSQPRRYPMNPNDFNRYTQDRRISVCRQFANLGWCHRGNTCQFHHHNGENTFLNYMMNLTNGMIDTEISKIHHKYKEKFNKQEERISKLEEKFTKQEQMLTKQEEILNKKKQIFNKQNVIINILKIEIDKLNNKINI